MDRASYGPGDVLAIDEKTPGKFKLSTEAYSKLVAGIYSTKPGILASRHSMSASDATEFTQELPLAVVGIVPCKVSDENGPIAPGDLLVTSSLPGFAMRGTDPSRLVGAIVGKAMEPLTGGKGAIRVLVSLQ